MLDICKEIKTVCVCVCVYVRERERERGMIKPREMIILVTVVKGREFY
jgi:hypothetical protein